MERAAPGFLFGLAPDGVFRALPITRQAVSSYLTFSPLPRPCGRGGLIFCGTFRRNALAFLPRVYLASYAASRPLVFGLSSPAVLSAEAILHPAGIIPNVAAFSPFRKHQKSPSR